MVETGADISGRMNGMRAISLAGGFVLLLIFFSGCTTTGEQEDMSGRLDTQLTLLMNGPATASEDITFELLAVRIISVDGEARDVLDHPRIVNSYGIEGRQILLGEKVLPEGEYEKLEFVFKEAVIKKKGRMTNLALPADGAKININASLRRNRNTTLFINWNADASVEEGYLFSPAFSVKRQVPELSSLLLYVSNEDSNNVSVVNIQSGDIAATVMTGKKPRGIATSKRGDRLKVYVANSGSNSISVIDPTTNKIENEIQVRFGREPEGIAVGALSSNIELLFVANRGSDNVSVINTTTYQELERVEVGRSPVAVAVDPPAAELTGTRFLSFEDVHVLRSYRERFLNVYVVNRDSNNVSVLRMDSATGRVSEVMTLNVEWSPIALDVDYQRGKVYVANYKSDKLSVIDILQTVKGNTADAVSTINNVGFSIIDIVADPAFDRIYLLKEVPGEIMIIRPFPAGPGSLKSALPPVMGIIPVGSLPRTLLLDREGRKLYVVNRGSDNLSVIDKTTKREEQTVPVGRSPYGVAVFPK